MKRECKATRAAMHAHLDSELSADQDQRVAAHLAECVECGEALEMAAGARNLLRSQPQPEVPPQLSAVIKARVSHELSRPARLGFEWRRAVAPAAAAAGLVLGVAFGYVLTQRPEVPVVAEAPPLVSDVMPAGPPYVPAEAEAEPAASPSIIRSASSRQVTTSQRPSVEAKVAETGVPASELEMVAMAPPPGEVQLAFADPADAGLSWPIPAGEVQAPAAPKEAVAVPMAPRTSPIARALSAEQRREADSMLQSEVAAGVVAGVLLDKFIQEHLVETTPTLLSVVTGTPSSDLGPAVADNGDEPGRFELCFTEAMRRALSETRE